MSSLGTKRPREDDHHDEASRPRKRPGGASRISKSQVEAVQQRQIQRAEEAQAAIHTRGVEEVVRQHYNAVPQRGREWRKTDSRIKGLRSFNNWVKSTIIHKFSPGDPSEDHRLRVLDIGCGKGGDLQKWQQAPRPVELYVGIDPAEVSIEQARDRYRQMRSRNRPGGRGGRGVYNDRRSQLFDAEFLAEDAFAYSLGDLGTIREVGFGAGSRWGPSGGFDVVSMMFCMHYAFESEAKAKGMLANVSSCLRKGGRFIGVIPNSDVIRAEILKFNKGRDKTATSTANGEGGRQESARHEVNEKAETQEQRPLESDQSAVNAHSEASQTKTSSPSPEAQMKVSSKSSLHLERSVNDTSDTPHAEWGNGIYRVRFPGETPKDGIFRPPYGHKYSYFMEEAVEEVPEYIVPWEAFRG